MGGSPPSASLEDISQDEKMDRLSGQVSSWLSSLETDGNVDTQAVRNSMTWPAPSRLRCSSTTFDFQAVRNSLSLVARSRLTYCRHLRLSAGAHFYFMGGTVTADMFPPFSPLSWFVFLFHSQHHQGWLIPTIFDHQEVRNSIHSQRHHQDSRLTCSYHFRLSASAYFNFKNCTITADMFAAFDSQCVRISIS